MLNVFLRAIPDPDTDDEGRLEAITRSIDDLVQGGVVALCTVMALIIAAFIDAVKYHRLGIYHATIACFLSGMLLLSAVAPATFAIALRRSLGDRIATRKNTARVDHMQKERDHMRKHFLAWSAICWVAQVILAAFGIWIYANVARHPYDNNPAFPHCESSTVAWFMGAHYIIGVEGPWQRMWVGFYAILTIPFLPFLVVLLNGIAGSLILLLVFFIAGRCGILVKDHVPRISRTWPSMGLCIALVFICIMTEMTVQANHVDVNDKPWGQGQIFPILVAVIPACQVLASLWTCFASRTNPQRTADEGKTADKSVETAQQTNGETV